MMPLLAAAAVQSSARARAASSHAVQVVSRAGVWAYDMVGGRAVYIKIVLPLLAAFVLQ